MKWFVLMGDTPVKIVVGGRDADIAQLVTDVKLYATEDGAQKAALKLNDYRLKQTPRYVVRATSDPEQDVATAICLAREQREAGLNEARAMKSELVSALSTLSMAPFDIERDGVVRHVSVDDARARVEKIKDTIAAAPAHVRRWL